MNDKERHSVHLKNKEICHKQTHVKTVEKDLIISSGIEMDENALVCLHHEYIYLKCTK